MVMRTKKNAPGVAGSTNSSVEVLLAEDVSNLGQQGDIVRVKPGYARNYLLPQGLATVATELNKRMVQRHRQRLADLQQEKLRGYAKLSDTVSKYSATIEANASKEGVLYGSIVAKDISEALKAAGHNVEPKHVRLEGPLKELGMYTVKLQFHEKVQTELKVWVVPVAGG